MGWHTTVRKKKLNIEKPCRRVCLSERDGNSRNVDSWFLSLPKTKHTKTECAWVRVRVRQASNSTNGMLLKYLLSWRMSESKVALTMLMWARIYLLLHGSIKKNTFWTPSKCRTLKVMGKTHVIVRGKIWRPFYMGAFWLLGSISRLRRCRKSAYTR